jgi:hypothetical protein
MSKRILNSALTIAIELAGHRPLDCGTGRGRLVEDRIASSMYKWILTGDPPRLSGLRTSIPGNSSASIITESPVAANFSGSGGEAVVARGFSAGDVAPTQQGEGAERIARELGFVARNCEPNRTQPPVTTMRQSHITVSLLRLPFERLKLGNGGKP